MKTQMGGKSSVLTDKSEPPTLGNKSKRLSWGTWDTAGGRGSHNWRTCGTQEQMGLGTLHFNIYYAEHRGVLWSPPNHCKSRVSDHPKMNIKLLAVLLNNGSPLITEHRKCQGFLFNLKGLDCCHGSYIIINQLLPNSNITIIISHTYGIATANTNLISEVYQSTEYTLC